MPGCAPAISADELFLKLFGADLDLLGTAAQRLALITSPIVAAPVQVGTDDEEGRRGA
ncbi:hypothetical protein ABZZ74_35035 [Streptomyces sp. NPDC006476]|uniref:hypothetical protein n=1 Tax=Streptomyces sp. NPDC006476 TaxID=3157175 RepID=UPI0033B42DDC